MLAGMLMKNVTQGGDTLVHATIAPELEGVGGKYLENSQIYTPATFSSSFENQLKMWHKSCEACGINDFFQ